MRQGFTFKTFVIFVLSAVQLVSGFALAAIAGFQTCLHVITEVNASQPPSTRASPLYNSDLASPSLEMMAEILTMRERGATNAILSLLQVSSGLMSPFLNRRVSILFLLLIPMNNACHSLIPHLFYANMRPALFTRTIIQSKKVLFPDGYPGPPPIEPTPEEQVLMREQLEKRLFDLVPRMSSNTSF
jgi:hypothetical protein